MPKFEELPSTLGTLDSGRLDETLVEKIEEQTLRLFTVGNIKFTHLFDPKSGEHKVVPVPINGSDFFSPVVDTFRHECKKMTDCLRLPKMSNQYLC